MSPTTRAGWGLGTLIPAAFQNTVGVLATLVCAPLAILFSVLGLERATYAQVKAWAWVLHVATGVRSRAVGLENVPATGSYIVISSHTSHLDGPAIALVLPHPVYFVIKKELARIPLWGHAALRIGFIAVDRSDSERARRELARALDTIHSGRKVLVFAEGTRSPDGRLQAFKKGGFHLAIDAQVPILPVAVNGSHRLLPKGAPAARPGLLEVAVGKPISTEGLTKADVEPLLERTREAILALRRRDPDFIEAREESPI